VTHTTAATPDIRALARQLRDREFPWTAATTYLNNASVGPLPERTRLALEAFNARRTAPHQLPDRDVLAMHAAARVAAAELIGAVPEEIALVPSTSVGLNIAARALPLQRGDIVLVSDREFPANVYPWQALRGQGVELELAPATSDGWPDEDHLVERLADPRVRVLAVSLVQFSNGFRADLERLSAACRANGAYLVVDAIQGLGHTPLDVRRLAVDLLACGGQKWLLSPFGSGFLYVRRELAATLEPVAVGWTGYEGNDDYANLTRYTDTLRDDARRFEVGTMGTQDVIGLTTSLGLLEELGIEAIAAYVHALAEPVLAWARRHEIRVVSPQDGIHRSAIVCVAPDDARAAHRQLKAAGIVCALREGAIRFSPHCYNTLEEMEKVVEVLEGMPG